MSLADAFTTPTRTIHGPTCGVYKILGTLESKDFETLSAVLDKNSPWTSTQIAAILSDQGHPIKADALQRHRRGACECGRP
ncbi:hypothetical protein UFOVP955_32 [uncultured Caudovirales phage]|uniref:Uncharacterized protein n=1 Tax=uncultured Caudovirales phage TaxID=2100421 RepID=A0A6J5PWT5_9CAUD|nr:hypothetical protein UFOVP955_32 [uncultured Caudovirales phage]CAB4185139.1 hypothetical protein UFOVP1120_7 [uncultured Caudovirales phage]CAB4191392.1 hypothetical protein UFOVP1227_33 [uncultured Caudovirales phage]CAB5229605.1 hypothetical protein UFOVP1571_7 [uncultured Caudovirales phage]